MSVLFLKIFNMSVSASWIVAAVLVLRLCLRRAPKWWSVLLWGIVAVRLVLPFSIESTWSLIPSIETISPAIMLEQTPSVQTGIPALNSVINPVIGSSLAPAPGASANPLQIWISVFTAVWIAGAALLLLYSAVSYGRLRWRLREAVRLQGRIYQSENVHSPFLFGIIQPKIYLPYHMESRDQCHVIAHEQAHLRRGDHIWKPLGFLLLTIHWFNPVMWLSYVLLCRDIELACDEAVIKELGNEQRADYMQALVTCSANRRTLAACPLAFGEIGIKERVKSVMHYKKPAIWIVLVAIIACVVLAACSLTDPVDSQKDTPSNTTAEAAAETASDSVSDTTPENPAAPTENKTDAELPAQSYAQEDAPAAAEPDNAQLDAAISAAVFDHYAGDVQEGQIHAESHALLATDSAADANGTEKLTAFLLVLQGAYHVDGGTVMQDSGSYIPTAITFQISSTGQYTPEEYWEPSDASYSDDIQAKFPTSAAEEALMNDQAYIDELNAACEQKVLEAVNGAGH